MMDGIKEILNKIPWWKATTPMIPIFFIDSLMVWFMIKIHTLNLEHEVTERFPTDTSFILFLGVNVLGIFVYLMLSAISIVAQDKIDRIRENRKLNVVG